MYFVTYNISHIGPIADIQCGDDRIIILFSSSLDYLEINLQSNICIRRKSNFPVFFGEKVHPCRRNSLMYLTQNGIEEKSFSEENFFIVRIGEIGYRIELVDERELEIVDLMEYGKESYELTNRDIPLDNLFIHNHEWCYTNPEDLTVRKIDDNSLVDIPYSEKYYSNLEYCCLVNEGKLVVIY